MRSRSRSIKLTIIILFAAIFFVFYFCHIQAVAAESEAKRVTKQLEAQFEHELSEVLKDAGLKNAGITMTKLTDDGVNYKYKISIYLPKYFDRSGNAMKELSGKLNSVDSHIDGASVSFYFS